MAEPFTSLTAVAIPLDESNVDTDQLVPARFSKLPIGPGHERVLFHDRRFHADERPNEAFIFNKPGYQGAKILVARRNFGIGSSRESAVMSVWSFGLRALIAPAFGDIFFNNCFKRGLLPIRLSEAEVQSLFEYLLPRPGATLTVDLPGQTVSAEGMGFRFDIGGVAKMCLLKGLDEVSMTQTHESEIAAFESAYYREFPWLAAGLDDSTAPHMKGNP
jgi:3-isopropylmalate/(R)-2-methylmalate dehydratase small subunit